MTRERSKNPNESQLSTAERDQGGPLSRRYLWPSFTPFGVMRRFANEIDRMFEDFGSTGGTVWPSFQAMESFSPQIDMFERDGKWSCGRIFPA